MAEQDPHLVVRAKAAYERDWAGWLDRQLVLLREGRFEELDRANLIDEVASLGRSDFKAFTSAIEIVLLHMLKWDHQPTERVRGWVLSIDEHRDRIAEELQDSPSYRARTAEAVLRAFPHARRGAARETGLPLRTFPEQCPYDWDAIVLRDHPHID